MRKKRPAKPTTNTTMRFPDDMLDRASARAAELGLSRSQYFISLVRRDLRRAGKTTDDGAPEPTAIFD